MEESGSDEESSGGREKWRRAEELPAAGAGQFSEAEELPAAGAGQFSERKPGNSEAIDYS